MFTFRLLLKKAQRWNKRKSLLSTGAPQADPVRPSWKNIPGLLGRAFWLGLKTGIGITAMLGTGGVGLFRPVSLLVGLVDREDSEDSQSQLL